jgi:hypothetical protein
MIEKLVQPPICGFCVEADGRMENDDTTTAGRFDAETSRSEGA